MNSDKMCILHKTKVFAMQMGLDGAEIHPFEKMKCKRNLYEIKSDFPI